MRKLWIAFTAVVVLSFAVLGWTGFRIYQQAPPVPTGGANDSTLVNRHRKQVNRSYAGPAVSQMIAAGEALSLSALITPTEGGIGSRVLSKTSGGNLTLFAFDAGQGLPTSTAFATLVSDVDVWLRAKP